MSNQRGRNPTLLDKASDIAWKAACEEQDRQVCQPRSNPDPDEAKWQGWVAITEFWVTYNKVLNQALKELNHTEARKGD